MGTKRQEFENWRGVRGEMLKKEKTDMGRYIEMDRGDDEMLTTMVDACCHRHVKASSSRTSWHGGRGFTHGIRSPSQLFNHILRIQPFKNSDLIVIFIYIF